MCNDSTKCANACVMCHHTAVLSGTLPGFLSVQPEFQEEIAGLVGCLAVITT